MALVKVINNDINTALKECRKIFSDVKRSKMRNMYYLRPGLRKIEKKKIAAIKRKFY